MDCLLGPSLAHGKALGTVEWSWASVSSREVRSLLSLRVPVPEWPSFAYSFWV